MPSQSNPHHSRTSRTSHTSHTSRTSHTQPSPPYTILTDHPRSYTVFRHCSPTKVLQWIDTLHNTFQQKTSRPYHRATFHLQGKHQQRDHQAIHYLCERMGLYDSSHQSLLTPNEPPRTQWPRSCTRPESGPSRTRTTPNTPPSTNTFHPQHWPRTGTLFTL